MALLRTDKLYTSIHNSCFFHKSLKIYNFCVSVPLFDSFPPCKSVRHARLRVEVWYCAYLSVMFHGSFICVCTWHCRSHFHWVLCRIFISWRLRMCNYDAAQKLSALASEDMSTMWTVCLMPARWWDNGGESRRDGVFPWCSNCSAAVTAGLGCCHVSAICSICESRFLL